jgi:hypothetical protein
VFPTANIRAVDANAKQLDDAIRDDLELVVVEPGAVPWLSGREELLARCLDAWVSGGGHALILGADVGQYLADLWGAEESGPLTGKVEAGADGQTYSFQWTDRTRLVTAPPEATVHVWLNSADGASPGAWSMRRGRGLVVGTAFRPALAEKGTGRDKQAGLLCEVLRPLLDDLPPDRRPKCQLATEAGSPSAR